MSTLTETATASSPMRLLGRVLDGLVIVFPMFSHILFGLHLGLMLWGGLWLRDRGLRDLLAWRR